MADNKPSTKVPLVLPQPKPPRDSIADPAAVQKALARAKRILRIANAWLAPMPKTIN